MPRNLKNQAQLQAIITKLKQENTHLRTLLKVILDTAYQAVNGSEEDEEPLYCWRCGIVIQAGHLCNDCGSEDDKPKKEEKC